MIRAINAADLRELVPMHTAVELMKQGFRLYSEGETISPLRTAIEMPDQSGVSLYMPAFVPENSAGPAASGAKIVSVYPGNKQRNLPTISAIVLMLDPTTGEPVALIEGAALTALRTGAVSGAATDLLAREGRVKLAVIGAGAQGCTQAAAVAAVREIDELRVVDLNREALDSFAERLAVWAPELVDRVSVGTSAEAAVTGADVICTATTATSPVFDDAWLREGAHINAIGAYTPEMREVPVATVGRARLVVDSTDAILAEAGDLLAAIDAGVIGEDALSIELGHLVADSSLGRQSDSEITLFKSVGNAIQDMIVGGYAVAAAESSNTGQSIDLDG